MNKPTTVQALEDLGRVRLSKSFFMRDFLYSEISQIDGIANIPDFPDRAIEAGRQLCEQLLEPLQERFGRIAIRSAYRAPAVNAKGAEDGNNCAKNESNYAAHIWDYPDADGHLGATACIVVPALLPWYDLVDARQPALRQPVLVPQACSLQPALERQPAGAAEHKYLCHQPAHR